MRLWKWFTQENTSKFQYLMKGSKKQYQQRKLKYASLSLILLLVMLLKQDFQNWWLVLVSALLFYKMPYLLLSMRHTQNCNEAVSAIPLWVNQIYALIEKNTIHNAIVNSYGEHTPNVIRNDLKLLIEQIEKSPNDKDAYLSFLSRYQIEGFLDIMLKLYEFRSLSKDKLKYEIRNLNQSLSKIETMKRQNQFKNEVFFGDTCTCFIIFIPCLYMTVISLMPSLFTV